MAVHKLFSPLDLAGRQTDFLSVILSQVYLQFFWSYRISSQFWRWGYTVKIIRGGELRDTGSEWGWRQIIIWRCVLIFPENKRAWWQDFWLPYTSRTSKLNSKRGVFFLGKRWHVLRLLCRHLVWWKWQRVKTCQTSITRERSTVFSLVLLIFPRWWPDAIKGGGGGGRGGENKPTNYPNEILPDFHGGSLVSHFYEQGKASQ